MAMKPFQSGVQDLVHSLDVGLGQRVVKQILFGLFVLLVMFLYTGANFKGFDNADAMEYAQLGRNVAEEGKLVSKVIRPSTMRLLMEQTAAAAPLIEAHPDLLHPPVYPYYLAIVFKLFKPDFEPDIATVTTYPADKLVVWLGGHLFTALTGWLLFLLGSRLFDRRIGTLGATVYFLSNAVWAGSISGTNVPMVSFFTTAAVLLALIAAEGQEKGKGTLGWLLPLVLAALVTLLACLTRYGAVALVPGIALYILLAFRKGWMWALLFLGIVTIGMVPWFARNQAVSGGLLGLTPATVLESTRFFPDDSFHRTLVPQVEEARKKGRSVQAKITRNLKRIYETNLRIVGDGFFICLFVTTFLYRFVRRHVHLLRWGIALSILVLILGASVFGGESAQLLIIFWPFVILYGLALFYLMLDRLQLPLMIYRQGITFLLVFLSAIPLIFAFMPPRKGFPYPPYSTQMVINISRLLEPEELMCSDIPWATAWYGNRTSLLLPQGVDEFYQINDNMMRVSGIYFTTETRNKPYVRNLRTGRDKDWYQIMEGRMLADFPLTRGFPIFNLDQIFVTDRNRLAEQSE